jgi:hypothetical protein
MTDLAECLKQNGGKEDVAILITMLPQVLQALRWRLIWIWGPDLYEKLCYSCPKGFTESLALFDTIGRVRVDPFQGFRIPYDG